MSGSNVDGLFSPYLGQGGWWYANAVLSALTTVQTIPLDTEKSNDGLVTVDLVTNNEITFVVPGWYIVNAMWSHENTGTGNQSINGWLEHDPGGGYTELIGSRCNTSVSGNAAADATENSTVRHWFSTGDLLRMQINRWAATVSINTRANMCGLTLFYAGDTIAV